MPKKQDTLQAANSGQDWCTELYTTQPCWRGFNPLACGYQKAARRRRFLLAVVCVSMALACVGLWFSQRLRAWQATLGIVVLVLPVVVTEWRWQNSRFCSHCGARTKKPRADTAYIWCPACHSLCDPAGISREPVGQFDVTSARVHGHIDPVLKLLDMILLAAIRDRAEVIRFEQEEHAFEIRSESQGKTYGWVPPPRWTHIPVAQAAKVIAGLDLAVSDRRQTGHIDFHCGGHPIIPADVIIEPAEFGENVTLRFVTEYWLPAALPIAAEEGLKRLFGTSHQVA